MLTKRTIGAMEFNGSLQAGGPYCAGDTVEVIDASDRRYGRVGRIVYFVGDNAYITFGRQRWSRPHMFFTDQLRAAAAPQSVNVDAGSSPLRYGAAWLLARLHR